MIYLILILILIIIIFFLIFFRKKIEEVIVYRSSKRERVEERKKKNLEVLKEQGKITNDDVQKLLGVSDATATNYLQELENERKINQVGKRGHTIAPFKIKG